VSTGIPLDTRGDGRAPMIGVRLPREIRERVIELSGGAISDFIRELVTREIGERAERGPPDAGGSPGAMPGR
jgi:hypothetical protein